MKKCLLFTLGIILFSIAAISQTSLTIVNPSFEFPGDSNKLNCNFNQIENFGWKIDSCGDSGREDSTKFGYDPTGTLGIQAYDGNRTGYSYNQDPHMYQVIEEVSSEGATYTLKAQAHISWPVADTTFAILYFSVFDGTDTANRTIVDSVLYQLAVPVDIPSSVWEEVQLVHSFAAGSPSAGMNLCIEFDNFYTTGGVTSAGSWVQWDMFELTKTGATGITSNTLSKSIELFPNPSTGIFNIKLTDATGNYIVTNLAGQEVTSGQLKQINNTIDLTRFGSGVYMLQVNTLYKTSFSKLIVK